MNIINAEDTTGMYDEIVSILGEPTPIRDAGLLIINRKEWKLGDLRVTQIFERMNETMEEQLYGEAKDLREEFGICFGDEMIEIYRDAFEDWEAAVVRIKRYALLCAIDADDGFTSEVKALQRMFVLAHAGVPVDPRLTTRVGVYGENFVNGNGVLVREILGGCRIEVTINGSFVIVGGSAEKIEDALRALPAHLLFDGSKGDQR